ncbi:MAG: TonB-dependent receptor, partial [Candidatus Marinimicrobia bacterium]|nr:TonB-dependent receptor [Candidatus Neomarinimicrobiota bacterium]
MNKPALTVLIMLTALNGQGLAKVTLTGTVRDAGSGAPLPAADVVVTGGRLAQATGAATDTDGIYRIPNLPPGSYQVRVMYIGYRTFNRELIITADSEPLLEIDYQLEPEAIRLQEFVVTASRGRREKLTDAPAAISVVTSAEIRRGTNPNLGDYFKHIKGVDFTASGIDGFNLSARGFNTSFSSRLMTLTDGRKANVPSLRLIAYNTIPVTSDDVDQIEVVLGPSSALYGPNAFAGVANIITKKPSASIGTDASVSFGNRDYRKFQMRHSGQFGNWGYKFSAVDFRASDWQWVDPEERKGHNELWIQNGGKIGDQLDAGEYPTAEDPWDWKWDGNDIRFDRDGDGDFYGPADTVFLASDSLRAGNGDMIVYLRADRNQDGILDTASFDVFNQRVDLRLDYDFSSNHGLVFGFGQAVATNINLTGIARYLAEDWVYRYYHLRYINGDLFIQSYLNTSQSGLTRNLRTGERIIDESTFYHFQAQHTANFTWPVEMLVSYGTDYQRTMPKTYGTILPDGKAGKSFDNDGIDNDGDGKVDEFAEGLITTNEYGLYFQSTAQLRPHVEFIFAGRLDLHSGEQDANGIRFIKDPLLGGTMNYRAQYSPKFGLLWKPVDNQTFRLTAARASNTPSSQGLYLDIVAGIAASSLVKARGNRSGYHFERAPDGTLMMYDVRPGSTQEFRLAQIPDSAILYIPPVLGRPGQFVQKEDVQNIAPITSELIWTYEIGYSGIINNRMRATMDIYYSEYGDFVSDLTWITPIVMDTLKYGFNSDAVIGLVGTSEFDGIDIGEDGIPGTADDKVDFDNPRELTLTNIN